MLKMISTAILAASTLSLGACATTSTEDVASPHYHPRDNKQGSGPGKSSTQPVRAPLHDHRQMK